MNSDKEYGICSCWPVAPSPVVALVSHLALPSELPLATMHHTLQAVSQEIQPQYERGDRQTRKQRHPRKHLCHSPGFIDHATPIGSGRRQTKAEEAEHPDCDCHVAKAQTRIDDERPQGIR